MPFWFGYFEKWKMLYKWRYPLFNAGPGFLKGEFLDHLNKLPRWRKLNTIARATKSMSVKPLELNRFLREVATECWMKPFSEKMTQFKQGLPIISINRLGLIKVEIFPIN
jgi:hypothetical protein